MDTPIQMRTSLLLAHQILRMLRFAHATEEDKLAATKIATLSLEASDIMWLDAAPYLEKAENAATILNPSQTDNAKREECLESMVDPILSDKEPLYEVFNHSGRHIKIYYSGRIEGLDDVVDACGANRIPPFLDTIIQTGTSLETLHRRSKTLWAAKADRKNEHQTPAESLDNTEQKPE